MTEAQWFSSTNPHEMLAFLQESDPSGPALILSWFGFRKGKFSARKRRLSACACLRRNWVLLADERSRQAIETTERFADGLTNRKIFNKAVQAARDASLQMARPRIMVGEWLQAAQARAADAVACALSANDPADEAVTWSKETARACATQKMTSSNSASQLMPEMATAARTPEAAWIAEAVAQCELLRDVIGNPFRRRPLDRSWCTSEVVAIAKGILRDGAFNRTLELTNLLEKAGCVDGDALHHCRDKVHVRGCWLLDFIVGKS
jgi:hypothetical protein